MTLPFRTLVPLLTAVLTFAVALSAPLAFAQTEPAPPANTAEPVPSDQAMKDQAASDNVVKMEAFQVSTSIGAYHEEASSMATKVPTSLKELASSLQILNASAIGDRNATTLQDVYGYIIGVTQSQSNTNGFTFRGFPNSGTFTQNIEYDGLQGGIYNSNPSSAANVESLEFLKGPNSVLYGQMHPGGLLNVVTKSPLDITEVNVRTYVSTYAGRYNNFGAKAGFGGMVDFTGALDQDKHWLYRLIVDAEDDKPFRPGDYTKNIEVFPSLTYRWDSATFFTVKLEYGQALSHKDDGVLPVFTTPIAFGVNARYYLPPLNTVYQDPTDTARDHGESLSTQFQKRWNNNWTLRTQTRVAWHSQLAHDLDTNSTTIFTPKAAFATPGTTFARQYNDIGSGHRYDYFDVNFYGNVGPEEFKQTLLIGLGGGQEFTQASRTAFGPNVSPISVLNPVLGQSLYPAEGTAVNGAAQTQDNLGAYLSDQIKIGDRLHVTIGTRRDQQVAHGIDPWNPIKTPYISQYVDAETSQAGLVFDLTREWSSYGSWSQSFVPNAVTSVDATGHAGFSPEKGEQYEGGFKFETPDKRFFASLAAYWIDRTNVLVTTGLTIPVTGQAIFRLDGAQHSEGVEFESEWQPLPNWQVQGGFALGKAFVAASVKNPQTVGLDLVSAPRTSGSLWNRYNVPDGVLKGLGVGLGANYVGQQWVGDPTSTVYFKTSGWTRVDLAFYYKWRRYSFTLSVQNLLDRQYILAAQGPTYLIPGDARKFTLSAQTRF